MKYWIPLLTLLFFSTITNAQKQQDSLYLIWEDKSQADSTRAIAFKHYISDGFFFSQPDSALTLTKQLYEFSKDKDYKLGMVDALSSLGYNYFRMGDYTKALDSYNEGLELANVLGDKKGASNMLLRTGFIYHDNGDISKALNYYQKSLKIFEELDDLNGVGSVYNEFGSIYRAKGQYEKSLDYYLKSIEINKKLNDEDGNSAMYLNIGSLYLDNEEYDKALENFKRGQAIYERFDDKLGIASSLNGIGEVYLAKGDEDKALGFFKRSLTISNGIDDVQGAVASMLAIAEISNNRGAYKTAISYCEKSLEWSKSLGDLDDQIAACDCLYIAYKAIGNGNTALQYHEKMLVFTDSLQTEEAATAIQNMEFAKTRLADSLIQVEKDLKVSQAHKDEVREKDKNRNIAIAIGAFFLLLAGGFYSRWRFVKKSKIVIEKEKNRSENLLLNILPAEIAEELKIKGNADARDFDLVSMLFTDFKGFTQASEKLTAKELIDEINECFKAFDFICEKFGIEKIKTIGDSYMAAGGLPVQSDQSVTNTVLAALAMQEFITNRIKDKLAKGEVSFKMRLGIHTGPVVAGIVGVKKFQYDIWGDTVNTASRMESNGEIGKVNISEDTYQLIKNDSQFLFISRGKIQVKGKGEMPMFFVEKSN